jgi:hypothetical protein
MAELPITDFTYSLVQRLLQDRLYDQAIVALSQRIEAQPEDRMARLLLLLANVSQFGTGPFNRQIEELRLFTDLTSNERHIIRQIFLVCFQHAERDGHALQKIVYQRLIRRLMLHQSLDLSISEARKIERSEETPGMSVAPAASTWTAINAEETEPEPFPEAPCRLDRWDKCALIGAGAMIVIVLLVFYVMAGRKTSYAQNPAQLLSLLSDDHEMEMSVDRTQPEVMLASTFTAQPTRRTLLNQLVGLQKAYAHWIAADPTTRGTVSLKLKVEPSGNVAEVEEVVSRLSEHRFIDVVVTEAKLWKLPHSGPTAAEISIPLIFDPKSTVPPSQEAAERKSREPTPLSEEIASAHTHFALEEAEPPSENFPTIAKNDRTLQPHTRGHLEETPDKEVSAGPEVNGLQDNATDKQEFTALPILAQTETEIARAAALKHEPRFAAEAIEKVALGTHVTVLRKERDWIKVKVQTSGNIGYLRKEYLTSFNSGR